MVAGSCLTDDDETLHWQGHHHVDDPPPAAVAVVPPVHLALMVQTFLAPGRRGRFDVVLLEANADLLVSDLLRNTKSSQTFRLFAAPDVTLTRSGSGYTVTLNGVDLFDATTGNAASRASDDISAWFLDTDYNGEVFRTHQAFFTKSDAWTQLTRALRDDVDPVALDSLTGFESLPFELGEHRRVAVRVIDDSGQTSESVLDAAAAR